MISSRCPLLGLLIPIAVVATSGFSLGVTVSSLTTLPLSNGAYSGLNEDETPSTYTKPRGMLLDGLTNGDPKSVSSRHIRAPRNNAQSFTIDSVEFEEGIELTAFAIQFEKRGNVDAIFDLRLFRIAGGDALASPLVEPDLSDVLVTGSSLVMPTAAEMGVETVNAESNGASGTLVFTFETSVHLAPGAYAFQLLPNWTSNVDLETMDWVHTNGNPYPAGRSFEDGVGVGNYDRNFALIGPVVPLEGDFNNDGMVNLADYTVWRDNLGGDAAVLNGNGSGNATVVVEDYSLWKANFGTSSGGGGPLAATNVPEPRAALLFGIVAAGLAALRRRGLSIYSFTARQESRWVPVEGCD